jgi:hypothetical protein
LAACIVALATASGCLAGNELEVASNTDDAEADFSFAATRAGLGIVEAGGDPMAFVDDGDQCSLPRKVQISYVGPDITNFEAFGFGDLVIENPWRMISAYLTELNAAGGVYGRCVQASVHNVDWSDPDAQWVKACRSIVSLDPEPVAVISLFGDARGVECIAAEAQIPMLGLHSSVPATVQRRSGGRLFLDDGTAGHLLGHSIVTAQEFDVVAPIDQLGLLYGPPVGTDATADDYNVGADFAEIAEIAEAPSSIPGVISHVPARFGDLGLLPLERRVRLLESNLTPAEQFAAQAELAQITDVGDLRLLADIEQFYLDEARKQRDSGVRAVFSAAPWFELRRLVLAAERIEWYPRWIANDSQNPTLVLPDLPSQQIENFFVVSSRPTVGDEPTALDRGCVATRQSAPGAEAFDFRPYSDAWILLIATCDALDVVMGALSRVSGAPTPDALAEMLAVASAESDAETRLRFGPGDYSGAQRFRVLQADFDCGLNPWGCMRAVSGWRDPSPAADR